MKRKRFTEEQIIRTLGYRMPVFGHRGLVQQNVDL